MKSLPLLGIVLLGLAIAYFMITADREETNEEEAIPDKTAREADISIKKFKFYEPYSDKGITWTLEADEGRYSEKDNETALLNKFRFRYQQINGLGLELEGKTAEYDNTGNEIKLYGDIKGKTSNGYLFYTEHLTFQQKEHYLKTDEPVTLVGPFFKMTGKGLFIDLEKEKLKMPKDIISIFDKESLNI
ncbi:MAG: LPS export ABC transporter periplasmic protein LptC [Deltaproteobacteria bacterium]|nr:LPS export ABC transporter periplasmic protein LptC [Deltaproteobacteria bacterium]